MGKKRPAKGHRKAASRPSRRPKVEPPPPALPILPFAVVGGCLICNGDLIVCAYCGEAEAACGCDEFSPADCTNCQGK